MLMENAFQQKHSLICSPLGDRMISQVKLIRNRNQEASSNRFYKFIYR